MPDIPVEAEEIEVAEPIGRRDFLKKASMAAGAAAVGGLALAACSKDDTSTAETTIAAPNIVKDVIEWTMVTTWPPTLPILADGVVNWANDVEKMSDGRIKITVYGAGELVPALEWFDNVSAGTAQVGNGAAYYNAGKAPASQFFAAVPFGMNYQQLMAWFFGGDGLKLWQDTYDEFNVVPFPAGNTGVQMGGWFNKEINSVDDFKGLKMRIPGLGGKVIDALGASATLVAGGEIYTNLERGVIDATEWVGPYHDELMGFYKVAKYYYFPGWHEPGTALELTINKSEWSKLPEDLKQICAIAAYNQNIWEIAQFDSQNGAALKRLTTENGVQLRPFPESVMATLRKTATEVIDGIAAGDPQSAKVWDNYQKFHEQVGGWSTVSEKAYYDLISPAYQL
ncbi:MAG: twin-arginine translocation signal domain-containing protein [Gammaproteobacteria bacterium]|nr:twin-arginine translocation signal domain-containing protein [Gammaproteobacteria bacterium]